MSKTVTNRKIRDFSILGSVIAYLLLRVFVGAKGGLISGAYFFSSYNFIILLLITIPWALLEITARHTRERMENNLYKNAKRVLYFGIIISVVYSLIVSGLVVLFRKGLCILFLSGENCELCLLLLLPLILFKSCSAVFKGFLLGSESKNNFFILVCIEYISTALAVILLSSAFSIYGSKVANILYDEKINSAFFAAGVALGLSVGAFIGLVVSIVAFILKERDMDIEDATKRIDDIYDLGMKMLSEVLLLGFSTLFCLSFVFVNQILMNEFYNHELSISSRLYQYGSYYSVFWCIVICPLLFTFIYTFLDRRSIRVGYLENNKTELRAKVSYMLKQFLAYSVPFAAFVCVDADVLAGAFLGGDSELVVTLIRTGVFAMVLFGISIVYMNILLGLERTNINTISGLVALVVEAALVYLCLTKTTLGLNSLIVGFYAFSFVYAFINITFTSKFLRFKIKIFKTLLKPIIAGVISAVLALILKLILGLFAPNLAIIIISMIIIFVVCFIAYMRMRTFTYQAVKRSALGFILVPLGRVLRLFREK